MDELSRWRRRRIRFDVYGYWSVAILVATCALLFDRQPYDPSAPPGANEAVHFVLMMLTPGAFVGLGAFAARYSRTPTFLLVATAVNLVGTWLVFRVGDSVARTDCYSPDPAESDCVPAVPTFAWAQHVWWMSLSFAVGVPLVLALVRWPKSPAPSPDPASA